MKPLRWVEVASTVGTVVGWLTDASPQACVGMATASGWTAVALMLGVDALRDRVGYVPPAIGLCGYLALRAIENIVDDPGDDDAPAFPGF